VTSTKTPETAPSTSTSIYILLCESLPGKSTNLPEKTIWTKEPQHKKKSKKQLIASHLTKTGLTRIPFDFFSIFSLYQL